MRDSIVIFRGPSISLLESQKYLPDAIYLPPAMQGDLYRAYLNYKPAAIGLIDGNFESIPAPWHKEILFLIAHNIKVFGSSSMGALRASELDTFGMIGLGEIYQKYTNEVIEDDDEVAILHAPKELDYKPLSDAMVDIRLTLEKAYSSKIISLELKSKLEDFYKNLFYKDRFYKKGIDFFSADYPDQICVFKSWLIDNQIKQKKDDAILLLKTIHAHAAFNNQELNFENTVYWHNMKFMIDQEFKKAS